MGSRLVSALTLAAAGITLAAPSYAWEPTKPVEIVVAAGAGGHRAWVCAHS